METTTEREIRRCRDTGRTFLADGPGVEHPPWECPYCGEKECLQEES